MNPLHPSSFENIHRPPENSASGADFNAIRQSRPFGPEDLNAGLNFLQSRPPAGSPAFLSRLQHALQSFFSLQNAISAKFAADRASGTGILEGASNFSRDVRAQMETISRYEALRPALSSTGLKDITHQFGSYAQDYLMGRLSEEAFLQIAGKAGIELPFSGIKEKAFSYITSRVSSLFGGGGSRAAAGGTAGAGINGAAGKAFGAVGAAYSAYNLIDRWGKMSPLEGAINGATAGAYIGSVIPVVGTAIGGAVGGLIGAIGGFIKKGKHKDQVARDQVRAFMLEQGMIDGNWNLRLANGEAFNIGRDGRNTLENLDGSRRAMYQTDPSNPLTPEVIGLANPLAAILTAGDEKLSTDFAGYFVNAALSNAGSTEEAKENMRAIFQSFNIHPEQALHNLALLNEAGKIDDHHLEAYVGGLLSILN